MNRHDNDNDEMARALPTTRIEIEDHQPWKSHGQQMHQHIADVPTQLGLAI